MKAADGLNLEDFATRWLVVDDIWIPLGETLLISKFKPLWNVALDGFGNHDPGRGRYQGLRPMWDVMHPGRYWAPRLRDRPESQADLEERVGSYLAEVEMPEDMHMRFDPGT